MSDAQKPPGFNPDAVVQQAEDEKKIRDAIVNLERENKSLSGQLQSFSPASLEELKKQNAELKATLVQIEKDLAAELVKRKNPLDAAGISDKLQVLKASVLAYCTDRQLDPAIWKKLESL